MVRLGVCVGGCGCGAVAVAVLLCNLHRRRMRVFVSCHGPHIYILCLFICALFSSLSPPQVVASYVELHGLSAWFTSSSCNPNNCIHQLCYLHSNQVQCCWFIM